MFEHGSRTVIGTIPGVIALFRLRAAAKLRRTGMRFGFPLLGFGLSFRLCFGLGSSFGVGGVAGCVRELVRIGSLFVNPQVRA